MFDIFGTLLVVDGLTKASLMPANSNKIRIIEITIDLVNQRYSTTHGRS